MGRLLDSPWTLLVVAWVGGFGAGYVFAYLVWT